jgi:hypothetical protein
MSELQRTIFSKESLELSKGLTVSTRALRHYGLQIGPEKTRFSSLGIQRQASRQRPIRELAGAVNVERAMQELPNFR